MQGMRWSWDDLQATPMYVRQFSWDLLNIKRIEEARRAEEARRQ